MAIYKPCFQLKLPCLFDKISPIPSSDYIPLVDKKLLVYHFFGLNRQLSIPILSFLNLPLLPLLSPQKYFSPFS
jgi:hypothetical protein